MLSVSDCLLTIPRVSIHHVGTMYESWMIMDVLKGMCPNMTNFAVPLPASLVLVQATRNIVPGPVAS